MGTVLSGLIDRIRRLRPSGGGAAPPPPPPPPPPRVDQLPAFFETHDQNRDGSVTVDELDGTGGGDGLWEFLGMDTDGDAAVSVAEYKEAAARRRRHDSAAARWAPREPPSMP